jgi:predicted acylesterase/phospholipase RssA
MLRRSSLLALLSLKSFAVDGGYFDNLPVSVMLSKGASSVFAVDVGSIDDTSPRNFGDAVSGWWVLIMRWWPVRALLCTLPF